MLLPYHILVWLDDEQEAQIGKMRLSDTGFHKTFIIVDMHDYVSRFL